MYHTIFLLIFQHESLKSKAMPLCHLTHHAITITSEEFNIDLILSYKAVHECLITFAPKCHSWLFCFPFAGWSSSLVFLSRQAMSYSLSLHCNTTFYHFCLSPPLKFLRPQASCLLECPTIWNSPGAFPYDPVMLNVSDKGISKGGVPFTLHHISRHVSVVSWCLWGWFSSFGTVKSIWSLPCESSLSPE